jgi:hypothetical protein
MLAMAACAMELGQNRSPENRGIALISLWARKRIAVTAGAGVEMSLDAARTSACATKRIFITFGGPQVHVDSLR